MSGTQGRTQSSRMYTSPPMGGCITLSSDNKSAQRAKFRERDSTRSLRRKGGYRRDGARAETSVRYYCCYLPMPPAPSPIIRENNTHTTNPFRSFFCLWRIQLSRDEKTRQRETERERMRKTNAQAFFTRLLAWP